MKKIMKSSNSHMINSKKFVALNKISKLGQKLLTPKTKNTEPEISSDKQPTILLENYQPQEGWQPLESQLTIDRTQTKEPSMHF